MSSAQAATAFQEGKLHLEHKDYANALQKLREAVELDGGNPEYLTTLGVSVCRLQKNYELAEKLCYQAVRKKHNDPQLYLNLAEVYVAEGKKEVALNALRDGLKYTLRDPRIKEQIRILGLRRPPVIPFLDRDSPLNKLLGKVRHTLLPKPRVH